MQRAASAGVARFIYAASSLRRCCRGGKNRGSKTASLARFHPLDGPPRIFLKEKAWPLMMVRLVGLLVPGAPPLSATVHRLSLLEVQENASGASGTTGSNLSEALSGRTTSVSQLVWPAGHVLQFCNAGGRCSLSQVGPT